MKVVVWPSSGYEQVAARLLTVSGLEVVTVHSLAQLEEQKDLGFEVFVAAGDRITEHSASVLRKMSSLRLLQLLSAGYDRVFTYGISDQVTVCNAGDILAPSVAEHAMALLLALVRQLPAAAELQREHRWDKESLRSTIRSLDGMTMAIVGLGSIGKEVAKRAAAFGMTVLGVSRSGSPCEFVHEAHAIAALHNVLGRADTVIIATPLTPETRHLMNETTFGALKPGALVVNVSRGGTVDQDALLRAIDRGIVAGAGLDVQAPEPLPLESPLWERHEIIITPHVGGLGSMHARLRLAEMVGDNVAAFQKGQPLRNCIHDAQQPATTHR